MLLSGAAYAALHQIKVHQFYNDLGLLLSTVPSPTENSRTQGNFKAFECFPVLFKADLIFKTAL